MTKGYCTDVASNKCHSASIELSPDIAGVGQITIKMDTNGNEQSSTTHYFHKDHLGSIPYISDSTGNMVQEMAYDPWGQRRIIYTPSPLSLSTLQNSYFKVTKPVTQRGFTGHEMIDEVGIIQIKVRICDAKLDRFRWCPLRGGNTLGQQSCRRTRGRSEV